jgi:hypothetical protein
MRSRNIKPAVYKNEQLVECSIAARWLWPGLWCLADCKGRLENRPKRIKMEIYPGDNIDVGPLLDELEENGLISFYGAESTGGIPPYIWIPKFTRHQNCHHAELKTGSILPPHPEEAEGQNNEALVQPESSPSLALGSPQSSLSLALVQPESSPADYRLPITEPRLPITESDRSARTQSGENPRNGTAKDSKNSPKYSANAAPRHKRATSKGKAQQCHKNGTQANGHISSVGDVLGEMQCNVPLQGEKIIRRILASTLEPPDTYTPFWAETGKRLQDVGATHILLDGLKHLEATEGIKSPGAWLNARCRDELKKHGKHMPAKPKAATR